jgi:hypothetical protein
MSDRALVIAYIVGYFGYAAAMICIWGFVYRPHMGLVHSSTWSNKTIVRIAFIQAIIWPFMLPIYSAVLAVFGITWVLDQGLSIVATKIAKQLPQEEHYSGFRKKSRAESRW